MCARQCARDCVRAHIARAPVSVRVGADRKHVDERVNHRLLIAPRRRRELAEASASVLQVQRFAAIARNFIATARLLSAIIRARIAIIQSAAAISRGALLRGRTLPNVKCAFRAEAVPCRAQAVSRSRLSVSAVGLSRPFARRRVLSLARHAVPSQRAGQGRVEHCRSPTGAPFRLTE